MKEPAMRHRASPTLIVACALLMSAPSIMSALSGALAINTLCFRLSLAFLVSYVGVRTLTRIVTGYARARYAPPTEADRQQQEDARA
jgi:hypothetical protein